MFNQKRIGQEEIEILSQKKLYKSLEDRKSEIRTNNYLKLMSAYYLPLAVTMLKKRDGILINDVTDSRVYSLAQTMIFRHKDENILDDLYSIKGVSA